MAKKKLEINLGNMLSDASLAYKDDDVLDYFGLSSDVVEEIEISKITPNPYQPRKKFDEEGLRELGESIKRHGLIQPIIVIRKDDGYMLIAGERRFRATKMLGESKIKAIVADVEGKNLRELALIENIQRENLNPIELANSYKELIEEYKITQEGLAGIIHKSRTQITNTMRLLTLSKDTQGFIEEGKITQGHAKVIVGLDANDEKMVVDTILGQKLSVRDTENLVKNLKDKSKGLVKNSVKIDENFLEQLENLQEILNKFNINSSVKNKNLVVKFDDIIDVERFIAIIK